MKNYKYLYLNYLTFIFLLSIGSINAQDVTTVEATSSDISENLDLEAVASIFGESKDLEEFEKKLNDPELKVSNLDLNEDGEVDYLRVLNNSEKDTHAITIQAVIGKDKFQDVATIDVEKDSKGDTKVQVVGDTYIYGTSYIIEPVYVYTPVIYTWFWGPYFRPWYSPFYWGYYPPYYRPWRPVPYGRYHSHVNVNIHVHKTTYNHTTVRRSNTSRDLSNKNKRNDYAKTNPNKSFNKRNSNVKNKQDLNKSRPSTKEVKPTTKNNKTSTGRKVDENFKPSNRSNKVTVPNNSRPNTAPSTRPSTNPSTRPSTSPSTRPSTSPSTRPSTPSTRPTPTTRPSAPRNVARPVRRN